VLGTYSFGRSDLSPDTLTRMGQNDSSVQPLTQLLNRLGNMDPEAERAFEKEVYGRLKRIAASAMRDEKAGHTLQPTALVGEFMAQLFDKTLPAWESRMHFYKVAAIKMRTLLVDHARKKRAAKRGEGKKTVLLEDFHALNWQDPDHVLAYEEAMAQLEHHYPDVGEILSLSVMAGLSDDEIADGMKISRATLQRRKKLGRAFLAKRMIGVHLEAADGL
jgi:RNA polymerase sigma-70 factor, ECF subfamily